MPKTKVTKAVIAAAGFGTRFLPQTKAMPKEMLPLVDKPVIQYIVEDLVAAGIKDIIIVGSSNKRSIEDHFDMPNQDLVANLVAGGKSKEGMLHEVTSIANLANFVYVRQKGPYGSATPILDAAHLIGNEPFIYTYADDLIVGKPNCFQQMMDYYNELEGSILPCIEVRQDAEYDRFGIIEGDEVQANVMRMRGITEKPGKAAAASNFASVKGYLLTPDIFSYLEKGAANLSPGQEFYLTTYVLEPMLRDNKALYACKIRDSKYYDTGNKLEYLKTVVEFALEHKELSADFRDYLREIVT